MKVARRVVSRAALFGAILVASDARAGATVDLLFVGQNGAPIAPTSSVVASASDTLTMAVMMRNDEALSVAVFSLNYDVDGDDELDVVSVLQWGGIAINAAGTDFFTTVGSYSPGASSTFVGSFVGAITNFSLPRTLPPAGGAFAAGYQMGTVVWKVNGAAFGAEIISGILNPGIDAFGDALFNLMDSRVLFHSASVNVPEPGTAALLGLGLLGLALRSRRLPTRDRSSGASCRCERAAQGTRAGGP